MKNKHKTYYHDTFHNQSIFFFLTNNFECKINIVNEHELYTRII